MFRDPTDESVGYFRTSLTGQEDVGVGVVAQTSTHLFLLDEGNDFNLTGGIR